MGAQQWWLGFTSQSPKRERVVWKDHPPALEEGGQRTKTQACMDGQTDRHSPAAS